MADKDMAERDVMIQEMPGISLLICLLHTLRTFRREISTDKMGITPAQRDVIHYFNKEWHSIRHQWVKGLKTEAFNLLTNTNNRVESVNQKLKAVITKNSGISQLFTDLMSALQSMSVEKDHRALKVLQKQLEKAHSLTVEERDAGGAFCIRSPAGLLNPTGGRFIVTEVDKQEQCNVINFLPELGVTCNTALQEGLYHDIPGTSSSTAAQGIGNNAYKHLPRQRKMNPTEKENVVTMLDIHANKKLLQDRLIKETGKVILLKDLHNLAATNKPSNDAQTLLELMQKVPGATVEILLEGQVITGIFFQTEEMKKTFQDFPEVLLIDATYKLNDIRMPLFVLMAIDGNGVSEIVALWLVQHEDRLTLENMIRIFKEKNSSWEGVQVVMADKDMVERDVMIQEMPGISLLICLFHTLRTFRREISTDKMGITPAQRDACREMLTKLAYAKSEEEYQVLHTIFQDSAPKQVIDYFNKEWHSIRHQWVEGLKTEAFNLLTNTNNRVESLNQKLKAVITKNSGISQFFTDLMSALQSMSVEKDHRALKVLQKRDL
ncbi:PREDICTED: uncharacterized protein LOC106813130 [Priapulus caudatus]|uniref:Uncharacterized protein LOC106813130 n=1 Tax=Priapulus caudatus TaxID=37621 RepID=A0ABM1EKF7_PRICU|nr:PREDICTED: uncharacterized protein LOC106813130 [Priapulus caudatus]